MRTPAVFLVRVRSYDERFHGVCRNSAYFLLTAKQNTGTRIPPIYAIQYSVQLSDSGVPVAGRTKRRIVTTTVHCQPTFSWLLRSHYYTSSTIAIMIQTMQYKHDKFKSIVDPRPTAHTLTQYLVHKIEYPYPEKHL